MKALEVLKILNKYYTGKFAIKINEAIEVNDRNKALELTDVIIKECKDLEAVELAKEMKWELGK